MTCTTSSYSPQLTRSRRKYSITLVGAFTCRRDFVAHRGQWIGINDKTLAEFVIALHEQSKTLAEFKQKLQDVGADFPESFVENMDRLILMQHPKHKQRKTAKKSKSVKKDDSTDGVLSEKERKARMFPGLAVPDTEWKPTEEFDDGKKDATVKEAEDLMAQLESVAKKKDRVRPSAGDFLPEERSPKRRRPNSPSPPRRSGRYRSPSPPRGRNGFDDNYRGRRIENGRSRLDEKPVLYKIYDGKVSSLKDFGAFISLDGVAGRVEGESVP